MAKLEETRRLEQTKSRECIDVVLMDPPLQSAMQLTEGQTEVVPPRGNETPDNCNSF